MACVDIAEAQEKLEELIDRVAHGETVEITRDGKPVAQLVSLNQATAGKTRKQPIDLERLRRLREDMPPQSEDAGTFMRRFRDDERY